MFVFSNLATSIDGKIATAKREHFPLGTEADRRQMQVLRRRADAVLMGAATLRAFKRPLLIRDSKKQILNVVLSTDLSGVSPRWKFFKEPGVRRLVFVTRALAPARQQAFEKTSELVVLKGRKALARQLVAHLEKRGVKKLLVEGGGSVMWEFLKGDLLDEINVTLTPWILGGVDAPTLVDGGGFSKKEAKKFRLQKAVRKKDELYLVYRKRY